MNQPDLEKLQRLIKATTQFNRDERKKRERNLQLLSKITTRR